MPNIVKNWNWKTWTGLGILLVITILDYINKANGMNYHIPDWIWPILAGFGLTINPNKTMDSSNTIKE